ncbi:MAG: hypothetical protein OXI96_09655, partial [Acidimicrobiaceae bacterium]|nr:hypothetical protein [Acidimicrobiaceae bacterium]
RGEFQKANSELRGEFQKANSEIRGELHEGIYGLRGELQKANSEIRTSLQKLSDGIAGNSQRLARIEGHLGINVLAKTVDDVNDDGMQPVLPVATDSPALVGETGKTSVS